MLSAAGTTTRRRRSPPAVVMLAAHVAGGRASARLLIAAGDRLVPMRVSRAVARRDADRRRAGRRRTPSWCIGGADQPLRSALLLAASVSHRGPPVSRSPLTDIPNDTRKPQSNAIPLPRAPSRALITVAATGAADSSALVAGAAPAWAHVHVDADNPAPGAYSVLTFQVPDESEKGALTTQLSVTLPNVASASTEVMPGWTATLDRDAAAGHRPFGHLDGRTRSRHRTGPVRTVPDLGEAARRADGQRSRPRRRIPTARS